MTSECTSGRFMKRTLGAALLTVALATSSAAPSFAVSTESASRESPSTSAAVQMAGDAGPATNVPGWEQQQMALLSEMVQPSIEGFTLDYDGALNAGVDATFAAEFAGGFVLGGGTVVNDTSLAPLIFTEEQRTLIDGARACLGTSGVGVYWWGHQLRLNSCHTQSLIGALQAGVGAAGVAGVITAATGVGGAAAVIAGAVLAVGLGAVTVCNMYGTGIYLNQLWTGAPFCWGQ